MQNLGLKCVTRHQPSCQFWLTLDGEILDYSSQYYWHRNLMANSWEFEWKIETQIFVLTSLFKFLWFKYLFRIAQWLCSISKKRMPMTDSLTLLVMTLSMFSQLFSNQINVPKQGSFSLVAYYCYSLETLDFKISPPSIVFIKKLFYCCLIIAQPRFLRVCFFSFTNL